MPGEPPRIFSREFKESAMHRILAGEKVRALAAELGLIARTYSSNSAATGMSKPGSRSSPDNRSVSVSSRTSVIAR